MTEASDQTDPTGSTDTDPPTENDQQQADSEDANPEQPVEHPTGQRQAAENAENEPPG